MQGSEETENVCPSPHGSHIHTITKISFSWLIYIIRIYQECEKGIEKSVPRMTAWHQEACLVMTNGDPEGQIFLSALLTNDGFQFLAHLSIFHFYFEVKKVNKQCLLDTPSTVRFREKT